MSPLLLSKELRGGIRQTAEFEVIYDEAAETTVAKEQVHPLPLVIDAAAALAADKVKGVNEFDEKGFEVADEGVFEVGLGVFAA